MYLDQFTNLGFHVSFKTILILVFYLMTAVYAIFSFILYYHWNEYSIDSVVTKKTLIGYFVITLPLLLALGLIAFSGN